MDEAKLIAVAKFVKDWLEDWGSELQETSDAYRDALVSGRFNGRKIPADYAKTFAKDYEERADAVYRCGALLERDILKEFDNND